MAGLNPSPEVYREIENQLNAAASRDPESIEATLNSYPTHERKAVEEVSQLVTTLTTKLLNRAQESASRISDGVWEALEAEARAEAGVDDA